MRERQRQQVSGQPRRVAGRMRAGACLPQVVVAEHHALRPPGRAAGVKQRGQVVIAPVDDARRLGRLQRGVRRGARARRSDHDHVPDFRGRRDRIGHLRQELRRRHDGDSSRVDQHVDQFHGAQQEHHRGDHSAGSPQRLVGDNHLGTVGHQHDDPVTGGDAERQQAAADVGSAGGQLGVAEGLALEEQRRVLAGALDRLLAERR